MAGILKVDTIQNANADNIITQTNSTTLTIGTSGDTVTLAAGATSSGFGRTGTVNWDTTKKTSGFTAVSGVGYFCDTSGGAFTATLPATPTAGDIVAFKDYANTFDTNNLTIERNDSNIEGAAVNSIQSIEGQSVTLIYVDATEGWSIIYSAQYSDLNQATFIVATGGTVLTCGDFKTHVFTGPGTFTVCSVGNPSGSNSVEYLVVAGGGGGGYTGAPDAQSSGGGGAGGYRQNFPSPAIAGLPVTATSYPITVGGGGNAVPGDSGGTGGNSVFSTITSAGGGGGAGPGNGGSGGSGGGGRNVGTGGAGNTPPVSPSQGNNGGNGAPVSGGATGGGGGGASAVGTNGSPGGPAGPGGVGSSIATTLFGPTAPSYGTSGPAPGRYFAGGGGGASEPATDGSGGSGGGGNAGPGGSSGTINTGGGGGGTAPNSAGGSGIVVIRYKFQ